MSTEQPDVAAIYSGFDAIQREGVTADFLRVVANMLDACTSEEQRRMFVRILGDLLRGDQTFPL